MECMEGDDFLLVKPLERYAIWLINYITFKIMHSIFADVPYARYYKNHEVAYVLFYHL